MFRVKVGDNEYKVTFYYAPQMEWTKCTIYQKRAADWDFCHADEARRSPRDNPCRAIGRKISLTRALKVFDKPTRTAFWVAFRAMGRPQGETRGSQSPTPRTV